MTATLQQQTTARQPAARPGPLTVPAAIRMANHGALCVQVRHRGVVVCGRLLEVGPTVDDGRAFFRVRSPFGDQWKPGEEVRQCGGLDGRCYCEGAAPDARQRGRRGAFAAPLGNTGTTA